MIDNNMGISRKDSNNDVNCITKAIEKFCKLGEAEAYTILWKLTYSEEIGEQTIRELGISEESVPRENISELKEEFYLQYMSQHPEIPKVNICEEYQLPYELEPVTVKAIFEHCWPFSLNQVKEKNNILRLLNSESQEEQIKALNMLGFYNKEVEYLLQYKPEISLMFQRICFINNGDEEENQKRKKKTKAETTKKSSSDKKYEELTPMSVIKNKNFFELLAKNEECMNALKTLGNMGFDLNEVIRKKEKIIKLINSVEVFLMAMNEFNQ